MTDEPTIVKFCWIADADGLVTSSGKVYDNTAIHQPPTGQTCKMLDIGAPLPEPGKTKWDASTSAFVAVAVTAPVLRESKNMELSMACSSDIMKGFWSNALGAWYFYPASETDQMNMLHGGLLMCMDTSNVWDHRDHDDDHAEAVRTKFKSTRDALRTKLTTLKAQVAAAATQSDVDAIKWT